MVEAVSIEFGEAEDWMGGREDGGGAFWVDSTLNGAL